MVDCGSSRGSGAAATRYRQPRVRTNVEFCINDEELCIIKNERLSIENDEFRSGSGESGLGQTGGASPSRGGSAGGSAVGQSPTRQRLTALPSTHSDPRIRTQPFPAQLLAEFGVEVVYEVVEEGEEGQQVGPDNSILHLNMLKIAFKMMKSVFKMMNSVIK